MKTLLRCCLLLAVLGLFALPASAQTWHLPSSPLSGGTTYPISFETYPLSHSNGNVTIWAKAPGSSTWSGSFGGGGGAPGNSNIIASGTIGFSVSGTWTIKAVDGNSDSSPLLNQTTINVTSPITSTTFSFSNLSFGYDGATKTASVTPNPSNATYTADLTKGPGVGSYTVSATANGSFSGSGSATLTISAANTTFSLSSTSFTYNGSPQGPSIWPSPGGASYSAGGTLSATNAGTYTATASAYGNYTGSNGSLTWTINKANPAALTLNASTTQNYGATQTLTTSGGSGSGAVSFAIVGQSSAGVATLSGASLTANSGAGWVDVQATKAADTNYNAGASATVRVNFAKATATVTLGSLNPVYDGTPKAATATTAPAGLSVGFTYNGSGTAPTAAGSYPVVGTISDANYAGSASGTMTIGQATQATLTLNASTAQVYNATQTLTSSGGSGGGAVTFAIVNQSGAGVATLSGAVLTATSSTGWVDVQATKAADTNYNAATSATVRITMSTANQATLTLSAATTQAYNTAQTLTSSGGSGSGAASFAIVNQSAAGVATLSGAVLTATSSTGWVDVQATKAADTNYNAATSATVRVTMGKANQATLTANASATQSYNTTQTLTSSGGSGTGALTYSIAGQSAAGVATLSGAVLTATSSTGWVDVQVTKAADTNYNVATSVTKRVTMGKANQTTLTVNANATQTYAATQTLTSSGGSGSGAVTFSIAGQSAAGVATLSGAVLTSTSSTGWVDVQVTKATDTNYNAATSVTKRVTMGKASLTIKADNQSRVFGAANPSLTASYTGLLNGDTSAVISGLTLATSATPSSAVGSYNITASGASATNYTISYQTGTLSITPLPVTFTFSNITFTYDGGAKAPTINNPSGATYSTTGTTSAVNAMGYSFTVTATGNYSGTATCNWSIGASVATVTLGSLNQVYTGTGRAATATTVPASLPVNFTYDGSSTAPINVGSYAVVGAVADPSGNYTGSASGTLAITKANQVALTLNAGATQTYAASQTFSTTGGNGSGTVSYSIVALSAAGAATLNGAVLTANTGTGWADVAATKAGDANYNAVSSSTVRVNFTKAAAAATLGSLSQTYTGAPLPATATTTPAGLTVGLTYNGSSTAPTNAGSYTVVGTINDVNYAGSASGTLTIAKANQAALTLGAVTTQTFGTAQTLSALGGSGSGTVSFAIAGQSTAGVATLSGATLTANTGTGWVDLTATRAGDANYNPVTSTTVRVTLAKAAASVVLNGVHQMYDGTAKPVAATTTPGGLTLTLTYAGSSTAPTNAGSYALVATINDANYAGTASGTLAIDPAAQTVAVSPAAVSIDYGQTVVLTASGAQTSYVWGGAASGTTSSVTLTPGAGTQTVTVYAPASANYARSNDATVQVSVTKALPTGTFTGKTVNGPYTVAAADLNATFIDPITNAATPGTVTYSVAAGTVLNAGTPTITATYPGDANHLAATATATFTVNRTTPTLSWTPASIPYGQAFGAAQLNATASVPGTFAYTPTAGAVASPIGPKAVSAVFAPTDSTNYDPASMTANVTVGLATQLINFPNPGTHTYGDMPFSLAATASSGLQVQYSVSPSNLATVSNGSILTIKGAGTITITATQGGDSNYSAASPVSQTFTVNKANQTITFPNPLNTGYVLTATASSGLPVQYASSDTNVAVISNYAAVDPNLPPVIVLKFIGNSLYQSVTVTASQPGDANYNAASSVSSPTLSSSGATSGWLTRPPAVLVQGTSNFPLRYSSVNSYGLRFESRLEPSGTWTQFGGSNGTGGRSVGSGDIFFSTPGTYTIHVLNTDGSGHESVDSSATLVISVLTGQMINFPDIPPQGVGFDVALGATATSGLPVSYTLVSGPGTVNGSVLHINAKGWIVVKASQAGNGTYAPALDVSTKIFAVEPPKIQLEAHSTPSGATGTLTGSGWAFDPQDGAPISVLLVIDGTVMPASLVTNGQARPDIQSQSAANGWSVRDVTNSGWSFSYDISLLPYGTHTCVVRATNSMGVHLDSASWTYTGGNTSNQQTITFAPLPHRNLGDAPFQLSATASSGLPVSFTVLSGPATISGNNIVTLGSTPGTVTIQATQAGNATAHWAPAPPVNQNFDLGSGTGPTGPTQLSNYPVGLTMMAKGTGTATLVVGGNTFHFKFQGSGSDWTSAMPLEQGFDWFAVQQVQLGTTYPVAVTSSGLTDFIVKAKIPSYVSPQMQVQVECGGNYVDSITQAELQGGSFNLRVVPTRVVPFAGMDTTKFEIQNTINIGLGASRAGETAGLFGWAGGAYLGLVKGPALEQSWETDSHVQVKAPAGYADLVRTPTTSILSFYPNGTYPFDGQFNNFSAATPLATYTFTTSGSSGSVTRTAGSVSLVLEWQGGPGGTVESTHQFADYGGGGQVETWQETITSSQYFWAWRTPGAPRAGATARLNSTQRTVQIYPNQQPSYQYQPILVTLTRHSSPNPPNQVDSTDQILSYEEHGFPIGDNNLVSETTVSYGYGAEAHAGPSRTSYVGTGLAISPLVAGNGLGGGTYTEYFSDAMYAGHSDNFNGQPGIAAGEIKTVRQSFLDDPVNSATDLVTTYTYGSDLVDGRAAPSGTTNQQGSTVIGSSTYSYATSTFNNLTTITSTVTTATSSAPGATLTKILRNYTRRATDIDLRGSPVAVTNPDNTKVSYAYQRGTLSSGTWAANPSGPQMLTAELHGKTGSTVSAYAGVALDPLDMDPYRSTVSERITDSNGQVLRDANYVYTGGSNFVLLSSVYSAYSRLGGLLMKADQPVTLDGSETPSTSGRVLYKATYDGWRKLTEEDEQGVALAYAYTSYDQVATMTRAGASAAGNTIAATTTSYSYDAGGRLNYESLSAAGETLTTGYTYDTANRPKTKSDPGGLNTSINYDSVVQTTTTLPSTSTATSTQVKVLYADGRAKSVTGSAVPDTTTVYSIDGSGNRVTTVTTAGSQVATTVTDWIGRTVSAARATFAGNTRVVSNTYNSLGQLAKQDTTVGGTKIALPHVYYYDTFGRLKREALDANANDAVDPGTDYNVKEYDVVFQSGAPGAAGSDWYRYESQLVWPYDGAKVGSSRYAVQRYQQVSGLTAAVSAHEVSLDFDRNRTESTVAIDRSAKTKTTTTTATGTTQSMQQVSLNGLPISSTNAQGQTTQQTYDALGRLKTSIDPRIGTTTYAYVAGTPFVEYAYAPDNTYVRYGYDTAGRIFSQSNPAGKSAYFDYDGAGNLLHQWGETVSPVRYEYNELGQKTKMHTYRTGSWGGSGLPSGFSGDGDVTTWNYQPSTGLLLSKQDAVNPATSYGYNDLDQLVGRTDSRGWVTSYEYMDPRKLLTRVAYGAGAHPVTTDVVYTYDHAGRQQTVSDATGQRSFAYYDSWSDDSYENELRNKSARLKSETLPSGFYGSSNNILNYDYQYAVAGGANGPASMLQIGTGGLYTVGYGYDTVGRPNSVSYNGTAFTYTYVPNSNLIDTVSSAAGYLRDYDYQTNSNRLDKVKHSWGAVTASQMETHLTYDPNTNLRNTEKTAGNGYLAALGRSGETGMHADYSYTDRFELDSSAKYVLLPVDWSVGALRPDTAKELNYDTIGNRTSDLAGTYSPNQLNQYTAAPNLGTFSYDENGNLRSDGVRTYDYDGENRLIKVTLGGSVWNYVYDYLGRRVEKNGTGLTTTRYLYDGWNLLAELDVSGNLVRRFAWGLDVSGTLQGAGGVGGLLQIDAGGASYNPVYDASHNVIALYTSGGAFAAAYEYDPFGNVQNAQGVYSSSNPFRAATKYADVETGLIYYGMRYYLPVLGRFINRDPMDEKGGINLYAFCGNNGVNRFDLLGMDGNDKPTDLPTVVVRPSDDNRDPGEEIADYQQQRILDELNTAKQAMTDYARSSGQAIAGFFWDGPKNSMIGLFNAANPLNQIKQIHAQWRSLLKRSKEVGILAADRELRQARMDGLKKAWAQLTGKLNTSRGTGELTFNITIVVVTFGDGLVAQANKSLAVLDEVSVNSLGAESTTLAGETEQMAQAASSADIADSIANGHAYDKHVIRDGMYGDITTDEFADHVQSVLDNPTMSKSLSGGRSAFWDDASQTVVIVNPAASDFGTAFAPKNGVNYFNSQLW